MEATGRTSHFVYCERNSRSPAARSHRDSRDVRSMHVGWESECVHNDWKDTGKWKGNCADSGASFAQTASRSNLRVQFYGLRQAPSCPSCGAIGELAHCSWAGIEYTLSSLVPLETSVARCSRAGIEYTADNKERRSELVARCSRAGIEYTTRVFLVMGSPVARCSRAGIEYT